MSSSDEDSLDELREYFSESEWSQLPKWEKKGYRNMKRIHLYLISIGQRCPTPAFMSRRGRAISPLGTPTWDPSDSEDDWESSEEEEERAVEEEEERAVEEKEEEERPEEEDERPSEERPPQDHTHTPSLERRPAEEEERPLPDHTHTSNSERRQEERSPSLERAPLDHSHTDTPDTSDSEDWTPSSERPWSGHSQTHTPDTGDSEEWTPSLETSPPPGHTHSPGAESSHTHTPDTSDSEDWTPISKNRPWQASRPFGPPATLPAGHTAGPLRHTPPQVCCTESGRQRDGLESLDGQRAGVQNATAKTPAVLKREWLKKQKSQLRSCWRGDNLRSKPRVSYTEGERRDDDLFYCEECGSFFVDECWIHGPPIFIPDTPTPVGVPDRARLTLPPGLEVSKSHIPNAGLGVFNQGYDLARGTHFGPYEGEVADKDQAIESGYSWVISKSHQEDEYIDANRHTHSNWMRYVNCARGREEQNLVAFQYRGEIVYRCCRPIGPGEELLVWYGEDYARKLDNTFDYLWDVKSSSTEVAVASQVFPCSLCPFSFTAQIYLQKHMKRSHLDEYEHRLKIGETRSETLLPFPGNRGGNHHTLRPTAWEYTPDIQPSSEQQRAHTQATHQHTHMAEKKQHCTDCGKNFSQEQCLKAHQRSHAGERPYRCILCGKSFIRDESFKRHQRTHTRERPIHCTQCGKSFTTKGHLKVHQRTHTGEGLYHCTQCGKSFTAKGHLKVHQRIHTGERPYLCTQCGKSFTQYGSFKRHQHTHTGERPFHCTQCGKSFTSGSDLQRHQLTHTRERPYVCIQCGKSFISGKDLEVHQRIHTGERPHHCTWCGKSFTQKIHLKIHQRIHTGERPYHCTQCDKTFSRKDYLQQHKHIHTGERPYIVGMTFTHVS